MAPKSSIQEAREYIDSIKAEYPDATHHPAAYIIGNHGEYGHANDDGEPGKRLVHQYLMYLEKMI